jgi:hypothetical protein
MRILAVAIALFAASFAAVFALRSAPSAQRLSRQPALSEKPADPNAVLRHLNALDSRFRQMNRTCSPDARRAVGLAFHDVHVAMMQATPDWSQGRSSPPDRPPSGPGAVKLRKTNDRAFGRLIKTKLQFDKMYAQIFNAARKGVLTSDHFPPGQSRQMIKSTIKAESFRPMPDPFEEYDLTKCKPL